MRPPPLAAYSAEFVPPVTGVNGSSAPVANIYDSSGTFQNRGRANSVKRRRVTEEIDAVFDRSVDYPPLTMPERPNLDLDKVKGLLVVAGSVAEELKPLLEEPNTDPKIMAIGKLNLSILEALTAVVDGGLLPLSASGPAMGRAGGGAGAWHPKVAPATAPKPTPPIGLKELREGLERADKESILFEANLGTATMANRTALASAFSAGIRSAAIDNAVAAGGDPAEAVRIMDDVLSCVDDMEFVGSGSKKFLSKNLEDPRNNTFCTMPIRLKFGDRSTRIHFETSVKKYCNLRATISLPRNIREEQMAFQKAVKTKYPDEVVTVRPDIKHAKLQAYRKLHGQKEWVKCPESVELMPGTLLPGYKPRQVFVLEPEVQVAVPAQEQQTDTQGSAPGGGS
jgi:hypothetical protein